MALGPLPSKGQLQEYWTLKNSKGKIDFFSEHFAYAVHTSSTGLSAASLGSSLIRISLEQLFYIKIGQVACPIVDIVKKNENRLDDITASDTLISADGDRYRFNYDYEHLAGSLSKRQEALMSIHLGIWKVVPFNNYVERKTFIRLKAAEDYCGPNLYVHIGYHEEYGIKKGEPHLKHAFTTSKKQMAEALLRKGQALDDKDNPLIAGLKPFTSASTDATTLLTLHNNIALIDNEKKFRASDSMTFSHFQQFVVGCDSGDFAGIEERSITIVKGAMSSYQPAPSTKSDVMYREFCEHLKATSKLHNRDAKVALRCLMECAAREYEANNSLLDIQEKAQ